MPVQKYLIKSGSYKDKWHVRIYKGKGKYFHVGRYTSEVEANKAMEKYRNAQSR